MDLTWQIQAQAVETTKAEMWKGGLVIPFSAALDWSLSFRFWIWAEGNVNVAVVRVEGIGGGGGLIAGVLLRKTLASLE